MNTLYDKLEWYSGEPELYDVMKKVFRALVDWMIKNKLLVPQQVDYYGEKIPSDFSLTSEDLTDKGNAVFKKAYNKWASSGALFEDPIDFTILEEAL